MSGFEEILPIAQTIFGGLGAAAAIGGAMKGAPSAPKPTLMPDTQDPAILEAKRRQAAAITQQSGRQSTILSQSDKLGGG